MSSKITSSEAFFAKFEMRVDNLSDRVSVFEIVEVHSAISGRRYSNAAHGANRS
jgi:hypothetical protein